MIPVLKTASVIKVVPAGATLTNLGNTERAPISVIISRGQEYALTYGVYLCADEKPAVSGNDRAVRKPIEEWDFDEAAPKVLYDVVPWVPMEVEGWQAEVAMKATPVDPEDSESQNVWDRVQDLIAAMPDGIEKIAAQTVLARGKIRRDSPMLAQLAPLVPLSEERVDDMFRLAASIEA